MHSFLELKYDQRVSNVILVPCAKLGPVRPIKRGKTRGLLGGGRLPPRHHFHALIEIKITDSLSKFYREFSKSFVW